MNDFTSMEEVYAFRILPPIKEIDERSPLMDFDMGHMSQTMMKHCELYNANTCVDFITRVHRTFGEDLPPHEMKMDPWFDIPEDRK